MNLDLSFYSWDLLRSFVISGLIFSVKLTIVATIGGILFGTMLALARLSGPIWLARLATIYVNGMRSVPALMVILWFFLLVPPGFYQLLPGGIEHRAEYSAYVTFIAFEAAYFGEIVRAGISSVSGGQANAGRALGMSYVQNMRYVIFPQAWRTMIPVFLTQVIILFQDTSLVYAIGAYDMLKGFETAGRNFSRPVEAYLLAAVVFFVICFALSKAANRLNQRVAIIR